MSPQRLAGLLLRTILIACRKRSRGPLKDADRPFPSRDARIVDAVFRCRFLAARLARRGRSSFPEEKLDQMIANAVNSTVSKMLPR
jgi:hypothetical protein